MFIRQQEAAVAVGSSEDRPHKIAAVLEVSVRDLLFGKRVTMRQLNEVGKCDLFCIRQIPKGSLKIGEAVHSARCSERSQLVTGKYVAKANHRSFLVDLELNP